MLIGYVCNFIPIMEMSYYKSFWNISKSARRRKFNESVVGQVLL